MKAPCNPANAGCVEPTIGKSGEDVNPLMYAFAVESTATLVLQFVIVPPKYVLYANAFPAALIFKTNASCVPLYVDLSAPLLTGKLEELVTPTTYTLLAPSTAIALACSG